MENDYVFLTEKEEMWIRMLMQVLEDNQIPYTALPVYDTALVIKGGVPNRMKVYVPGENKAAAEELVNELFCRETGFSE